MTRYAGLLKDLESDTLRGSVLRNVLDWGSDFTKEIVPGSLGELRSPDEREPDAHKWLLDELEKRTSEEDAFIVAYDMRRDYIPRYGFVLPTREMIDTIGEHAPNGVLDFGCGNGYLSFVLQHNRVMCIPVDENPPQTGLNEYWQHNRRTALPLPESLQRHWLPIMPGGIESIAGCPKDAALLLSWPPHGEDMATRAVSAYQGDTLLYIGERGGATADETFESILETQWQQIAVAGTSFQGIHDRLHVFKRLPG